MSDYIILVDLDSVLDTRLSTINTFGVDVLKCAFKSNYKERIIDRWVGVDESAYATRYRNRNRSILREAIKTCIPKVISDTIRSVVSESANSPYPVNPGIQVNTHPYVLTDDDVETLRAIFKTLFKEVSLTNIKFVNLSDAEITPIYIRNNHITVMFKYDWIDWLRTHVESQAFKDNPSPNTYLIGPTLFVGEIPDTNSVNKAKEENLTHFDALTLCMAPYIHLSLLDSVYFSIDVVLDASKIK